MYRLANIIFIVLITLHTGCSRNKSDIHDVNTEPVVESNIEDIVWNLEEYTSTDGTQIINLVEGTRYQFNAVSETGELRAFVNCNSGGGGTYQINDGYITLEFRYFGEFDCTHNGEVLAGEAYRAQDSAINSMLIVYPNISLMYSFNGDALVLTMPDGRYMVFNEVEAFAE